MRSWPLRRLVVSNSTPLIVLGNVGRAELLRDVYGQVLIPQAVRREVLAKEDAAARLLAAAPGWIAVREAPTPDVASLIRSQLHAGEVEAIMLARSVGADLVILDDNAAKKAAKRLGMDVTGTLGVLVRAKREGLIERVGPVLDELDDVGFYASKRVREFVLSRAGEV